MSQKIRLNKYLSSAGVCSRRKADDLIASGRVQINQKKVTQMGTKIDPTMDQVSVAGMPIALPQNSITYALNKPLGVVSTASDDQGRQTVVSLVPSKPRVYPVGRLDADSEGLLLLTNDGGLSQRLTHPKHHILKTYQVLINNRLNSNQLNRIRTGLRLKKFKADPANIEFTKLDDQNFWYQIQIKEGKNRQIRRMMSAVGAETIRLIRTHIGDLSLDELGDKQAIKLSSEQLSLLTHDFD